MFAVPVFAVIFVELGNAVQESSRAAGCYQIRVDECLRLFTNTTTSVPYREQFFSVTQFQHYQPLIHNISPLLPCHSVCQDVYFNCLYYLQLRDGFSNKYHPTIYDNYSCW